jgi:hypothetical protein
MTMTAEDYSMIKGGEDEENITQIAARRRGAVAADGCGIDHVR